MKKHVDNILVVAPVGFVHNCISLKKTPVSAKAQITPDAENNAIKTRDVAPKSLLDLMKNLHEKNHNISEAILITW
jgi:hypothetical protein